MSPVRKFFRLSAFPPFRAPARTPAAPSPIGLTCGRPRPTNQIPEDARSASLPPTPRTRHAESALPILEVLVRSAGTPLRGFKAALALTQGPVPRLKAPLSATETPLLGLEVQFPSAEAPLLRLEVPFPFPQTSLLRLEMAFPCGETPLTTLKTRHLRKLAPFDHFSTTTLALDPILSTFNSPTLN